MAVPTQTHTNNIIHLHLSSHKHGHYHLPRSLCLSIYKTPLLPFRQQLRMKPSTTHLWINSSTIIFRRSRTWFARKHDQSLGQQDKESTSSFWTRIYSLFSSSRSRRKAHCKPLQRERVLIIRCGGVFRSCFQDAPCGYFMALACLGPRCAFTEQEVLTGSPQHVYPEPSTLSTTYHPSLAMHLT